MLEGNNRLENRPLMLDDSKKCHRRCRLVKRGFVSISMREELVVDVASRDVWIRGQLHDPTLPRKEFDILEVLYRNKGRAISRGEIASAGWPERADGDVTDEEIDQYIRRLRTRIEIDASDPKLIVTFRGFGYRMT